MRGLRPSCVSSVSISSVSSSEGGRANTDELWPITHGGEDRHRERSEAILSFKANAKFFGRFGWAVSLLRSEAILSSVGRASETVSKPTIPSRHL